MQNLVPSGASDLQRGQRISAPSGTAVQAPGKRAAGGPTPAPEIHEWMVWQYSRAGLVSSEKHEPAAKARADEGGGDAAGVVLVTAVGG
jgi:hypothetical protein